MKRLILLGMSLFCAGILASTTPSTAGADDQAAPKADLKKDAIPDAASQAKATKLVDDVYKKDIAAAKDARAKVLLANKLLTAATESQDDRAGAFAILNKAMELAASGGDITTTFTAIDALDAGWQIDLFTTREHAFVQLGKSGAPAGELIGRVEDAVAGAIGAERYDVARKIAETGVAVARDSRDAKLVKLAQNGVAEVNQAMAAGQKIRKAMSVLEASPQDPAANLEVGKYRCFIKGDWTSGLPHLVLGGDAVIRALASRETANDHTPQIELEIADAWYDFAQKEQDLARRNILRHAGEYYAMAAPRLTGLAKAKAQQRLGEIGPHDTVAAGGWIDLIMPANESRVVRSGDVTETPEGIKLGPGSGSTLRTAEELSPPFKVEFVAKLDTTHLHMGYAKGYIILNQEDSPDVLRFADPNTGAEKHFEKSGKIETGQFVRIGLIFTEKTVEVFVDGKSRAQITGDFSKCKSKLSIESRFGAIVVVKSFRVQGLP